MFAGCLQGCMEGHEGPQGIVIIGAGIIGLTSAISLLDAGYTNVRVCAKAIDGSEVCSQRMAGWWIADDEYTVHAKDRLRAKRTFEMFRSQTHHDFVKMMNGYRLLQKKLKPKGSDNNLLPWFQEFIPSLRRMTPAEIKRFSSGNPGVIDGWTMEDVLINPGAYLGWLREQLKEKGGVLEVKCFTSIAEVIRDAAGAVIVNCSGLGARQLVGDTGMYAVRGQTVLVDAPMLDYWVSVSSKKEEFAAKEDQGDGDGDRLKNKRNVTYMFPVGDGSVLLGGTKRFVDVNAAEAEQSSIIDSLDYEPEDDVTQQIIQGCAKVEPRVQKAKVLRAQVGYRPFRAGGEIRVELEKLKQNNGILIHNYGHSDYGMGVCWGCAIEVVELLDEALGRSAMETESKM